MKPKTKKALVKTSESVLHHQKYGDLHDGDIIDVDEKMDFAKETIFFSVDEAKKEKASFKSNSESR